MADFFCVLVYARFGKINIILTRPKHSEQNFAIGSCAVYKDATVWLFRSGRTAPNIVGIGFASMRAALSARKVQRDFA